MNILRDLQARAIQQEDSLNEVKASAIRQEDSLNEVKAVFANARSLNAV